MKRISIHESAPVTKNPVAVALGRMARGHAKSISDKDRARRRKWARGLAKIRAAKREAATTAASL